MCFFFLGEGPWDHHTAGVSSNPELQSGVNTGSSTVRPLRYFNITEGIQRKGAVKTEDVRLIDWLSLTDLFGLMGLLVRCCLMNWLAGADWAAGVRGWILMVI